MKIMNPKIMPMIKRFVLLIFIIAFHVTLCLAEGETLDSTTPPETTAPTSSEPETTATPEATATTSPVPVTTDSPDPTATTSNQPQSTDPTEPNPTVSPEEPPNPVPTEDPEPTETVSSDPGPTESPSPSETITPEPTPTSSPVPGETEHPDPTASESPEPTPSTTPGHTEMPSSTTPPEITTAPEHAWNLQVENAVLDNQVWNLTSADTGSLSVHWNPVPSADQYSIRLESVSLHEPVLAQANTNHWSIPLKDLENGFFTMSISAFFNGNQVDECTCSLRITLSNPEATMEPESTPEPTATPNPTITPVSDTENAESDSDEDNQQPGSKNSMKKIPQFSRKRNSSSKSGDSSTTVVAGKALSSQHASGTRDLTPHNAIVLELPAEQISMLPLGDTDCILSLENGSFTAEIQETSLVLISNTSNAAFSFSQAALSLLHNSGMNELLLINDNNAVTVKTDLEFSGYQYGKYRSEGYVSSDFIFHVQDSQVLVSVDEAIFLIAEDGELIPANHRHSFTSGGNQP